MENLAIDIAKILDNKKAQDIQVLNIKNLSIISDYFVICSGSSITQVKALSDELEEKLAMKGYELLNKEGYGTATWILLNFGDVVVHIFHHEARNFYNLERIWSDAKEVMIEYK